MRILFITSISDRSEFHLIKGLKERGVEVRVVCDPNDARLPELVALGLESSGLRIRHRFDLRAVKVIREILKSKPYDLIYVTSARGASTSVLASFGIAVKIVAYRGTQGHIYHLDPASLLSFLNPKISTILCNCDAVRRHLLGLGVPSRKLCTVYKGHDLAWYECEPAAVREEFGIPRDALLIGCIANVRSVKGVDLVIKALRLISSSRPVHLIIVGELRGANLSALAKKCGVADRVHLAGYRPDAPQVVRACDLTVMASRAREGVPRAVVESMAQGVPVVVTNVGGMPEIVRHRQDGLVVQPDRPAALATAIEHLANHPELAKEYGASAKERVRQRLSLADYITSTLHLFEHLTVATPAVVPLTKPADRCKISAFIVCCNEDSKIRRALQSVKWCDEIVMVDSGSTDRTLAIGREFTSRIIHQPWLGYSRQKQHALTCCQFDWILNIDADEEISPDLRSEIERMLSLPQIDRDRVHGYELHRMVFFLKRWWRRGGWHREYRLRLFQKQFSQWGGIDPHERAMVTGPVKRMQGTLYHYTYDSLRDQVISLHRHATTASKEILANGIEIRIYHLVFRPLARFVKFYILRRGFLEGVAGFVVAVNEGWYTFLKFAKAWEEQQGLGKEPVTAEEMSIVDQESKDEVVGV